MKKHHLFFILALIAILLGIALQSQLVFNPDNSWLLDCARQLMQGKKYFIDFFEVNPPLILFCYMPTILFSNVTHLSVHFSFRLLLALLVVFVLFLVFQLTKKQPKKIRYTIIAALIYSLFFFYPMIFGEHEYFAIVFSLPYFFLAQKRFKKETFSLPFVIATSLLSAIGFCLKPYFLLAFIFVVLYQCQIKKSLRPAFYIENLTVVLFAPIYLLSIYYLTPEYMTQIVPFSLRWYYLNFSYVSPALLLRLPYLFITFTWVFYFLFRADSTQKKLLDILFFAAAGFLFAYLIAHQPWPYHFFPAYLLYILIDAIILAELYTPRFFTGNGCLCLILIVLLASTSILSTKSTLLFLQSNYQPIHASLQSFFRNKKDKTFYSLSLEMLNSTTLVNAGGVRVQRYPNPIYLFRASFAAVQKSKTTKERKQALTNQKELVRFILYSLRKYPNYIFVQYNTTKNSAPFFYPKIIDRLKQYPDFQKVWRHYHFVKNFKIDNLPGNYNYSALFKRNR